MTDWDDRVLIVVSRTPGFTYNTNIVAANEVPQKVEDVLNPKWKGKIASTPYAASFDRLALIWGEEKTTAFLQKFVQAGGRADSLWRGGADRQRRVCHVGVQLRFGGAAGARRAHRSTGKFSETPGSCLIGMLRCGGMRGNPNAATLLAAFLLNKERDKIFSTRPSAAARIW